MVKTNPIAELWFQSTEVPWGENEGIEPHGDVYRCQGEGPRLDGSVLVTSVLHFPVSVSCPTIPTVSMAWGLGVPRSTWCWKDRDEPQWKRVPEIVVSLKNKEYIIRGTVSEQDTRQFGC